ncbi:AI-2E family transporter [Chitinimonas sp. PSY-7]|uniref:AI-2E family transporter n=1 Tax=Chitinimonas sp. PSY-7 TaxID=3459088 RepID=UPI0040400457
MGRPDTAIARLAQVMTHRPSWVGKALVAIAVVFLLQAAKAILIPVAFAGILVFTLAPPVRWLQALRIPNYIGAAAVMAVLLSMVSLTCVLLARPAVEWWESTPNNLHQLVASFDRLRMAVPLLAPPPALPGPARQALPAPSDPLKDKLASESVAFTGVVLTHAASLAFSVLATLILTYLLLISERWIITHLIAALPNRRQRALVLGGLREAQREIGHFLATMGLLNVGLGIATGIAMAIAGVPHPALWGAIAGVLNFIPYFGPLTTAILLILTGVSTFNELGSMLAPAAIFMLIIVVESNWISPWLVGRRLQLSQLAIFFSVLVWVWLWGVCGAFLAVPILIGLRCFLRRRHSRLLCALLARNGSTPPSFKSLLAKRGV